jgi:hypothetical protein
MYVEKVLRSRLTRSCRVKPLRRPPSPCFFSPNNQPARHTHVAPPESRLRMKTVEHGRKTPQLFSISTFKYENKNENGQAVHEHELELTEFRKRTYSSGIMSNTVGVRKLIRNIDRSCVTLNKCMTKLTSA